MGGNLKKQLKYQVEKRVLAEGLELEVLVFENINPNPLDGACCLCGLKLRKGEHTWVVHKYNGFKTLLPVEPEELWRDDRVTQGAVAVGAECRKQLPPEFTKKVWGR